jgi:Capsule assembly protein Wzi
MPPSARRLALLLVALPVRLAAQASPYIALDDPRLPALEHLIAAGDVDDPSPQVRPFRRADAVRVLDSALARSDTRDTALVAALLAAWTDDTATARWRVEGRAGGQGYTEARRDPLHPGGPKGVRPYLDLRLEAIFGNLALVSRPAIETRLTRDPDWPGRTDLKVTGREVEAYVSAQFRWARLFYGQMDRNWGPGGVPGIGLSNYGYPRPELGLEVGNDRFRLTALASTLADVTDTLGRVDHRYFFAHRLDATLSRRLRLGLWETVVLGGPDRSFDARYRNPVTLLLLANQYGLGDQGNVLLGLDVSWRVGRRTTLQGQFGLDDFQYQNRSSPTRTPDRYAFTLAGTGALSGTLAWHALYTQASSLAFRTSNPIEDFTDQGVGLGRSFADDDQLTLRVTAPVTPHWLVAPELTLLRQGQGRVTDPFPQGTARGNTPTLFLGTVERTWRAALGLSGEQGPLGLQASAGVHYIQNDGNVSGRTRTRFVARIQATLGLGREGRF